MNQTAKPKRGDIAAVRANDIWSIARAEFGPAGSTLLWYEWPTRDYVCVCGAEQRLVMLEPADGSPPEPPAPPEPVGGRVASGPPPPEAPEPVLDRRDEFARAALQGLLAAGWRPKDDSGFRALARKAVDAADATIIELEKGTQP